MTEDDRSEPSADDQSLPGGVDGAETSPPVPPSWSPPGPPEGGSRPPQEPAESFFQPSRPPPYPGFGSPGWHGSDQYPAAEPDHYTATPYDPARYHPMPAAVQRTPWLAICLVTLVIGLVAGTVTALVVVALDTGNRSTFSRVEPIGEDPAPLPSGNVNVARVADTVLPSVVQIQVRSGAQGATGSGFVLDGHGNVVTNNHVVELAADQGSIAVVLPNGSKHVGHLVGRSPAYDLAVVSIHAAHLSPARVGSSGGLRVGQTVVAFGSPLGLTSTVTSGIVSALDRPVTAGGSGETSFINAIQTDAAINPGNSGGPLVDLEGRVVGVNSAIATLGGIEGQTGSIGVGFAIPIDQVRLTAEQILETGKAVYPVIGASVPDVQGQPAEITDLAAGSPAEQAGLEVGDVVREVDGQPIADSVELIVTIRSYLPGETIEVGFVRDGKRRVTRITLDERQG